MVNTLKRHQHVGTSFFFMYIIILRLVFERKMIRFKLEYSFFSFPFALDFISSIKIKMTKNINYEKCLLCNFTVRNEFYANSTPYDLIITCIFGVAKQLFIFIRTLRTVHYKGKCIILIDEKALESIDKKTLLYSLDCGIQFVNYGKFIFPKGTGVIFRFHMMTEYIRFNKNQINRVIICDLFDTVFQGDPFNTQVNMYQLNVADEGMPYNHAWSHANRAWIQYSDPNYPLPRDQDFYYFCAGVIGASVDVMLNFLYEELKLFTVDALVNDQGVLNYLYLSGILQKKAVSVVPKRKSELIYHSYFTMFEPNHDKYKIGMFPSIRNNSFYCSVIHQAYSTGVLKGSLSNACPQPDKSMKNYINDKTR